MKGNRNERQNHNVTSSKGKHLHRLSDRGVSISDGDEARKLRLNSVSRG
jgi:hypothetical protein